MKMDYSHPTSDFVEHIDIHTLLPQQEPFVMVDTLTYYDSTTVKTRTSLKADNVFMYDNDLATAGMIENIAQTCAARIGYVNNYILRKGGQIGVIANVRKLKVFGHPHVGSMIETTVSIQAEALGMTLANATIEENGKLLAKTQIKLAINEARPI